MPPGPKRKGSNRKDDKFSDKKKQNSILGHSDVASKMERLITEDEKVAKKTENRENITENRRYVKRAVVSNADRYEEAVIDSHADVLRGSDYEVLLSCSGGIGSQLRLHEERDWDDSRVDGKNIFLDFNTLSNSFKCIPLHIRLNLPKDIFDPSQISSFLNKAESNINSWSSCKETFNSASLRPKRSELESCVAENLNLSIIENIKEEDEIGEHTITKHPLIAEKTENLIESLASCLSLKNKTELQLNQMENSDLMPSPEPVEVLTSADDLDFLLSLGVPAKSSNSLVQEDKHSGMTNSSVDDWLNSILDD